MKPCDAALLRIPLKERTHNSLGVGGGGDSISIRNQFAGYMVQWPSLAFHGDTPIRDKEA